MDRSYAGKKAPARVAFFATLLFPVLGAACLLFSERVAEHLPHILGAAMLFVGAADIVTDLLDRDSTPGKITVGTDVVMVVLGIVTLLNTRESLNVIAIMWGLLGLEKAAREIDESLAAHGQGAGWVAPLITGIFELTLGTMLLISPLTSVGHHVLLLGLELLVFPFHVHGGSKSIELDL
ncbi:MAG: DUF308 domain-containing protein [Coriobacteriaceae bacterium]|nr:DUF308 domain-containing protein [Coriobacteriaceae bacterium]